MSGYYDIAQICLNGHIVNSSLQRFPESNRAFCPKCGEKTITNCPDCKAEIKGSYFGNIVITLDESPAYCHNCGKSYPWTESKIATAIQILTEFGNLNDEEKKTIAQDINNIARDIPQAELSANRIKQIWKKCSMAGYEFIMEFASRTAAKVLKNP